MVSARYVEASEGVATLVGAGIDSLTVSILPDTVVVQLAARLYGSADDFHDFTVHVSVDGPNLERVQEIAYPYKFPEVAAGDDRLEPAFTFPLAAVFPVEVEGIYSVIVRASEGQPWTLPFLVSLIPTDPT